MRFRRLLAALLVLAMAITLLPAGAFAAEETEAVVNNNQMTLNGTNAYGNLLSADISAAQTQKAEAMEDYEGGYTLTELKFAGSTATVTYDAMEEANEKDLFAHTAVRTAVRVYCSGKDSVRNCPNYPDTHTDFCGTHRNRRSHRSTPGNHPARCGARGVCFEFCG